MIFSLAMAGPVLAAAPGNDLYPGRATVSIGFSASVDTTEATTDADDVGINQNCGAPATDASVWYQLTAAADGWIGVDVSASSYTAGVAVATGSPGSFELLNCGPGATAFEAITGETYAILAFDDQFDGGGNGGTLEIQIGAVPPPPVVDITVNRSGTFNSATGSATISGTVTCTGGPAEFSFIDVSLRQQVGRFFVDGFGFIEGFVCDGTVQTWSVEVFGFNGTFRGGKGLAVTFAVACGQFLCGFDFEERVVQLRGGKK
ncbi:MAG: hypothetical protein ABIQ58_00095 [Candidatus Limnocylindrales bacterium]